MNFWCGLAVLFFVLMTMISVIVETVASGTMLGGPTDPDSVSDRQQREPGSIWCGTFDDFYPVTYCGTGYDIFAKKIFLEKPKDIKPLKTLVLKEENPVNRLENIRIGIGGIPVVLILAAGVFGMMNEYFG